MTVVLRFAPCVVDDMTEFVFHVDQTMDRNDDGSMTARFTVSGVHEMCWHLGTWGTSVNVEQPESLRRRLAQMCVTLASHHGGAS